MSCELVRFRESVAKRLLVLMIWRNLSLTPSANGARSISRKTRVRRRLTHPIAAVRQEIHPPLTLRPQMNIPSEKIAPAELL